MQVEHVSKTVGPYLYEYDIYKFGNEKRAKIHGEIKLNLSGTILSPLFYGTIQSLSLVNSELKLYIKKIISLNIQPADSGEGLLFTGATLIDKRSNLISADVQYLITSPPRTCIITWYVEVEIE